MKLFISSILSLCFILPSLALAQEQNLEGPKQGHTNQNKFRQLYNEFSTPNDYRTASGAPGPEYYQQRADYVMDIKIDDETQRLYGEETITYTNNSPDALAYLWVQLDQNIRKKDSPALLKNSQSLEQVSQLSTFANNHLGDPFDGGFNIEKVTDAQGKPLAIHHQSNHDANRPANPIAVGWSSGVFHQMVVQHQQPRGQPCAFGL